MPVRFRCSECRSKLSIATRKIGTTVACPRCGRPVVVPAKDGERVDELELVGAGSGARQAGGSPDPPLFAGPGADLEDRPLFERDDFEEMLDPAVRAAKEVDEPLPLPHAAKAPEPPKPPAAEGIFIMRSTATILMAAVVVLMAVAFAAGFLVGSR